MKNMKKLTALILSCVLMAGALAGCGNNTGNPGNPGNNSTSSGNSSSGGAGQTGEPEYVIQYSHVQGTSTPTHQAMEWLKTWLEEQSNGRVSMDIFPAGQLYDDSSEIDAITAGNIDMISTYISKLTTLDTSMQYSIAPFLFDSTEQMLACFADPEVQSKLFRNLEAQGIKVMGAFYGGDVMLFSADKEIHTPADFKGMKVRENVGPMSTAQYAAMDASAITVAYGELYTGLQSGLADAVCTTLDGVTGIALQETLKYGLNLNHQQACYLIQFNADKFNSYPQDVQDLISEGIALASQKEYEICKENRENYIREIEAGGCVINDATEEELAQFHALWDPITKEFVPADWMETIDNFKANYQG